MNCSPPTKKRARRKARWGAILFWFVVGFLVGVLVVGVINFVFTTPARAAEADFEVSTSISAPIPTIAPESTPPPVPDPDPEPVKTLLGEYRITAYCACEICCGQWANNRPEGKVVGAAGVELTPGVAVASPLPFGTVLEIEGLGQYTVQDRIAQWVVDKYDGQVVDIYFADHEAACEFGLQYHDVYIVGGTENG